LAGVALVGGAIALSVGTLGVGSPAAAIGIGVGVGVLSGMGVTAMAQTGVATALGKKIDYLQFAKQMAIGGTIGAVAGIGGVGITVATQGVSSLATNAAMLQIAITPTDGKAIAGIVKNKVQGNPLRQANGMIGYRRQMQLEDVKLENQLIMRKGESVLSLENSKNMHIIINNEDTDGEPYDPNADLDPSSMTFEDLEKQRSSLLDKLFETI